MMNYSAIQSGTNAEARGAEVIREGLLLALNSLELLSAKSKAANAEAAEGLEDRVRNVLKSRRSRDAVFGDDLFADPAWDILLELFAAHLSQQRMSVSSVCIGAAVPATTALRWVTTLEARGTIVRMEDPFDKRRSYLSLSSATIAKMHYFFEISPARAYTV